MFHVEPKSLKIRQINKKPLNPKTLTGTTKMNQETINAIEREIRTETRRALRKAVENLNEARILRLHLLDNRMTLNSTYGKASEKIHNQRMKLWNQVKAYNIAISALLEEIYKKL